jgi:PhnB protein
MTISQVTPYLCVRDAAAAIEFYKQAFGATEMFRLADPVGKIGHAEMKFGAAVIMLADEFPNWDFQSPLTYGGSGTSLHLQVDDVDAIFNQAVAAGAKVIRPPKNEFYGERSAKVVDPYGHVWMLAQHVEDVSPEEMQRRWDEMLKNPGTR